MPREPNYMKEAFQRQENLIALGGIAVAGVVFNAGHPAADAGDDIAAGPLMELVVEFWSNHYMALYHAGAARFELGDHEVAEGYLERFLVEYAVADGWRSNALAMLEQIGDR